MTVCGMPGGMGYLSYVYPPRDPLPAGEYCAQHNPTALLSQQVHLIVHCSRLPHVVQLVCDSRQCAFVPIGGSAMLCRHSRVAMLTSTGDTAEAQQGDPIATGPAASIFLTA